jgi:hypothetical protein
MGGPQFNEPIEETFTEWFNPLDVEQYVDVREGDSPRPTRYRVPAGGTKQIPSRHDSVVHRVHNGVIIGGQAPQLVRRGSSDHLDDALNTELHKKKVAEAELAQAALQKQVAEENAAVAAAKIGEADKNLKGRPLPPDAAKRG